MTDWITSAGAPAAVGTGTSKVTIFSTFKVDSSARQLIAIQPIVHTTAPAAAESVFVIVGIEGSDFKNQPFKVFAPIGGAHLGTIGGNNLRNPRWHQMGAKLQGNETFKIFAQPLDAMAGNARVGVNFKFSDQPPSGTAIHSECVTQTSTGTTAGTASGETMTIQNGSRLIAIEGAVTSSTVTADEPLSVNIALNSTGFKPINDFDFEIVGDTVEATSGIQTAYPFESTVDSSIVGATIQITSVYTLRLTLTAAGQAAYCIKYI